VAFQLFSTIPEEPQRAPARLKVLLPGVRQRQSSGASLYQKDAKVLFQTCHSPADRGGRYLQLLRCGRQSASLPDRHKHTYIIEIRMFHSANFGRLSLVEPTISVALPQRSIASVIVSKRRLIDLL